MLSSYLPVLVSLMVAVGFPAALLVVGTLFGPKLKLPVKQEPYECGVPPVGSTHNRLPVKFYRLAIIFLIFDVEAAFLFPWAVLFRSKISTWGPLFLVGELLVFMVILVAGYVYAWRTGALEWD